MKDELLKRKTKLLTRKAQLQQRMVELKQEIELVSANINAVFGALELLEDLLSTPKEDSTPSTQ